MKKTSASVLALLFATSKAVRINKVEGWEPVDDGAEKVHVLDLGMKTMSNSPKDAPEWAFPDTRTAFYSQTGAEIVYDNQNGLWRNNLAQRHKRPDTDITAVKPPPEGDIGDVVYEHAMNATDGGIPNDRSHSKAPSLH
jgi:hypothetical protein